MVAAGAALHEMIRRPTAGRNRGDCKKTMLNTFVVYVEINRRADARASLFRRRAFNIDSLTVAARKGGSFAHDIVSTDYDRRSVEATFIS